MSNSFDKYGEQIYFIQGKESECEIYKGNFLDDRPHGRGKLQLVELEKPITEDGAIEGKIKAEYIGKFENGKFNGKGSYYTFDDQIELHEYVTEKHYFYTAQKLTGNFKDGLVNEDDVEIIIYASQTPITAVDDIDEYSYCRKYKGQYKDGLEGFGKYEFNELYKTHINGSLGWRLRKIYEGTFSNSDIVTGNYTEYQLAQIINYEGEFKNYEFNGNGTLTIEVTENSNSARSNGEIKRIHSGIFRDNNLNGKGIKTIHYDTNRKSKPNYFRYKEEFVYKGDYINGRLHGPGVLEIYMNDEKSAEYCGNFKGDIAKGKGKLSRRNEIFFEGEFKNDKAIGNGKLFIIEKSHIIECIGRFKHGKLDIESATIGAYCITKPINVNLTMHNFKKYIDYKNPLIKEETNKIIKNSRIEMISISLKFPY